MWALMKLNVLRAMATHRFGKDPDSFADFYCKQYDLCIKLGGDLIYGVPIINGNVSAMRKVMSGALKKGIAAQGNNYMLVKEMKPAFDAYWMGAEPAPIPNPLLKPGLWPTTIPAPGATTNIGPFPPQMIISMVRTAALIAIAKALVEAIKNKTVEIPMIEVIPIRLSTKITKEGLPPPPQFPKIVKVKVNLYETAMAALKGKPLPVQLRNHPIIAVAKELILTFQDLKRRKPSIGIQFKIGLKFPFPKLPDRKKLIEMAKKKLIEAAMKIAEEQLVKPIMDIVIAPYVQQIKSAIAAAKSAGETIQDISEADIKSYLKNAINGAAAQFPIPNIEIPKIDVAQIKAEIKRLTPTKDQIKAYAEDLIRSKIPNIPFIHFPVFPNNWFKTSSNTLLDPFINMAKMDMLTRKGIHNIIALYPPAGVPGPAILQWQGYRVKDGPKIPPIPFVIPKALTIPTKVPLARIPTIPRIANMLPPLGVPNVQKPTLPKIPNVPNKGSLFKTLPIPNPVIGQINTQIPGKPKLPG